MTTVKSFDEITFNGGGSDLMDPMITKVVDQINLERKGAKAKEALGFVDTRPLSSKETYSSVNGVNELPAILENGTKEEIEVSVWPEKGYKIVEYGGKITSSFLFWEWLKKSQTLKGASDDLKAEFVNQAKKSKKLMQAADKGMEYECTKVYTLGFDITSAYWPGSATPKGQPLFSNSHTIFATGWTFSNLQTGALSSTTLKEAIQKHIDIRLENGDRVDQPRTEGYTLYVSADNEMAAREILNNGSKFAASGANSAVENVFMFEGSRVKLEIMEKLGSYDKDGNMIWTKDMWFVVNKPALKMAEALKFIRLYSPIVKQYMNNETDQSIVDIRNGFAADHYGAEYFIVWSEWTSSS